jgi:LytS/YehU family sensor histidine kinase
VLQLEKTEVRGATAGQQVLASDRAYYLSQLCGWGFYGVVQYFLYPNRGSDTAVLVAVWCSTGMFGTHLLRTCANRRRWQTIPALVVPLAVAALVIPFVMDAARTAASVLLLREHFVVEPGWLLLVHYFQAVLVVSVWCAVFLSGTEVRRRRIAEMEALRLALIAQVAQYRALRSQLHPHFLFNCLTGLLELIDEDRDRAKQVVIRLSELLRYTLRAERVETVPFKEELDAVEGYLLLEKVRFEERLRVRLDIEPASLSVQLPPMLLQTLAENAVKHGIARLPTGGALSIAARVVEHELRIEVINTGGFIVATEESANVGLENARARLRLMYGARASLTVATLDEHNVRAVLVIPVSLHGVGS